jgi:glutamate formiminotransferase / formiminotetrahydrofolate cyclodeaminase
MERIVECVPNFSEGRDPAAIKAITDAITSVPGIGLLDVDPGVNAHRTVVTFIGEPEEVAEAAFRGIRRAAEVIDMRRHHGEHPRIGASDVVPFVPVSGVTMEECVEIARRVGRLVGDELGIPVYLYEQAATSLRRRNLAVVRAGEYEGLKEKIKDPEWAPDFGPAEFNARSGATVIGARQFLIAYNVNLNTADRRYANDIAYALRERGRWKRTGDIDPFYYKGKVVRFAGDGTWPCGPCDFVGTSFEELERHYHQVHGGDLRARYESLGIDPESPQGPVFTDGRFREVKAIGWTIEQYRRAQISINLTDFRISPPHLVLEAAREEAARRGITVTGSEVIGLIPYEAMRESARWYRHRMRKTAGIPVPDLMETAIQSLGLRDVGPFDSSEKVLGMPGVTGPLVQRTTWDFVDEVSRETPAPGGGSVAALAGSLGAALASMVANLSSGKPGWDDRYEELCEIAENAQQIKDDLVRGIDQDTTAFDAVLTAIRMPRDSGQERAERARAIQQGYQGAIQVPLATVARCRDALGLCVRMSRMADPEMVSDVGTGALVARAGARAAGYNVRINLRHIEDPAYIQKTRANLEAMLAECDQLAEQTEAEVEKVLAG